MWKEKWSGAVVRRSSRTGRANGQVENEINLALLRHCERILVKTQWTGRDVEVHGKHMALQA